MKNSKNVKQMIGKIFNDIADGIETGEFQGKIKIGITTLGSEHGVENIVKGAELAAENAQGYEIILIGPKVDTKLKIVEVDEEEDAHKKMEELLDQGEIQSCVTMHYNFPIGVATVGKVITPGKGKEMIIATTTGATSSNRIEAMVKNALYGIIAAKASGIKEPTLGILNVDGARQVERALKKLNSNGYKINFAQSMRSEGGSIMRGNDLLVGTPDVMVQDTLTGNILMKVFSSFSTGGDYEALGYGYGPGIGQDYDKNILIISRASGIPVVAGAVKYAANLVKGNLKGIIKKEFESAKKAKLNEILKSITHDNKKIENLDDEEVKIPTAEIVTETISGIDIIDLDDAVKVLWEKGIYAETAMGCTGPIIMVNEGKIENVNTILAKANYIKK